jgi:maleylacetoacetate isomerase
MAEITLYHYWRSSASWRVRWALEYKKIPHVKIHVNLLAAEEKSPDFLAVNPAGYLPALVVDGHVLAESLAIIEWLDENESTSSPALLPKDTFMRAKVRQLAETINSGTQPLQNLDVMKRISSDTEVQGQWVTHWITRGLGVYEKILSSLPVKKFSVSDEPTMADLCLIPQVYSANRFKVDMNQFPRCKAIYEYALTTPACAQSVPELFQPAPTK